MHVAWASSALARAALLAAVAGALLGILAKVADESTVGWLADLGTHPALWVAIIAVIGRVGATAAGAAVQAASFGVALCLGYYTWQVAVLGFGVGAVAVAWVLLAVTAAPAAAAATWWATRRRGPAPGAVMAVLAGVVLSGGALRGVWLHASGLLPRFAVRPVQGAVEVAVVAVLVIALPRHAATRLWGGALLVPAWVTPDLLNPLVGRFV